MTLKSGIDLTNLDHSTRPQDDLFRFVNGSVARHDRDPGATGPGSGTFDILREQSTSRVRDDHRGGGGRPSGRSGHAEAHRSATSTPASWTPSASRSSASRRSQAAAGRGRGSVGTRRPARRPSDGCTRQGGPGLLHLWVAPTSARPEDYVVYLEQGGLGLPDESYYREDSYAEIRTAYVAHIARMLGLAGIPDAADKARDRIMALETRLAGAPLGQRRQPRRDEDLQRPHLDELEALAPEFPWGAWRRGARARREAFDKVVVRQPSYRQRSGGRRSTRSTSRTGARGCAFHVVARRRPLLPQALVDEDFDFSGRTLSGPAGEHGALEARRLPRRGRRSARPSASCMPREYFPPAAKERMLELVAQPRRGVPAVLRRRWSGWAPQTREQALAKLDAFTPKIGYPDAGGTTPRSRSTRRPRRQRRGAQRSSRSTASSPSSASRSTATSGSCCRRRSTPTTCRR